jgi:hypothetical protein
MAFHETFWAVTAGVAPVLGLAAVMSARSLVESALVLHAQREQDGRNDSIVGECALDFLA